MRRTAWQVSTATVMGTPRLGSLRARDPGLSALSQGAFHQRLADPWWRNRESSCSVPVSPLPPAHSCSAGRVGGRTSEGEHLGPGPQNRHRLGCLIFSEEQAACSNKPRLSCQHPLCGHPSCHWDRSWVDESRRQATAGAYGPLLVCTY